MTSSDKNSNALDLNALMAKAQQGDSLAYHEVLKVALPLVRKIVSQRWPADASMREDVVQDVLMHVHRARHTYDPARPFKPWLYAITRYRVIECLRSFGRHQGRETLADDDFFETFSHSHTNRGSEDPETHLTRADALAKALDQLPKKQRKVIELVKVEGLTMQEAADKTGMSVSAVKVTSHRALKTLRQIAKEEDDLR